MPGLFNPLIERFDVNKWMWIAGLLALLCGQAQARQALNACLNTSLMCMAACKGMSCLNSCQAEMDRCTQRYLDDNDNDNDNDDAEEPPARPSFTPPAVRITQAPEAPAPQRREGVAAPGCLQLSRLRGGFNVSDVEVTNHCTQTVEASGACLSPSTQVKANYPSPGTYSFNGWRTTLSAGKKEADPLAEMCQKRGGRVVYAACSQGSPYFTSQDATRFRCVP